MDIYEKSTQISSYTSKLLRYKFGRGPKSCYAAISQKYIVLYIQGFISPMEEVLYEQGQLLNVKLARFVIIQHILEELKGFIQSELNVEVIDHYHDWNFPNNSGIIVLVLNKTLNKPPVDVQFDIPSLETEVARISKIVQKVPDEISTYAISPNIYLVERIGILILIEKALISKGFNKELRLTKDELEKNYFHQDTRFSEIFPQGVQDIFIDWDFKNDKSIICFILNKGK